ncbi:MAG: lysylphosphatidylglycerol synthase transmembrane domain-containing protein [Omnitrophica WOR_2 bacterium]
MRKFLIALAIFLGVIFFIWKIAEVQAIVDTLKRGDWRFLLFAFLIEIAWLMNVAYSYQTIFAAIGLEEKIRYLLPIAAAANFLNVIAPSAGMSGMAVFASEAHRRNYSPGRAAIAGALYVLLDYSAFFCILGLGLVVLVRRHDLNVGEIIATILLLGLAVFIATLIYLGMRSAVLLGRVLSWLARQVNRFFWVFIHHDYLSEKRAHEFAFEAAEGLSELGREPGRLALPFGLAITKELLLVTVLYLSFLAFAVPVSIGTLIAGFSIGYLFLIISPTPSGLGVVEGVLTLVLSSMHVPLGAAAVVTIAYRGFTFWLPLLFGIAAFRLLGRSKKVIRDAKIDLTNTNL